MTTPNIRFKSFSTEWSNSTLETLFTEFKSGKSITSQTIFEEGAYPVFGGNGLRGYTDTYTHDDEFFLIGRQGALCGNINDFHGKAFNSEHAIVCIANEDNSTKFLSQRLKHLNLNKLSESSAQPGLAVNKLLKLKLFVPSHEEQQKIADFLTSVDEKINFLKKKKELLEQYKKGVMQKIFSQELRFKDDEGNDFPEWEEKKLGEISFINMGQSPDSKFYNSTKLGLPLIQGNADISKRATVPRIYTTHITKTCEKGDIILTVRAPVGSVAISNQKSCLGRGVCSIKANGIASDKFLYQYFLYYENQWARLEQGSTFTAVNGSDIRNLLIPLPHLSAQNKIADFLSALGDKITLVENQIDQTELWKKGLLQQMFV